jgi:hypothetical protein
MRDSGIESERWRENGILDNGGMLALLALFFLPFHLHAYTYIYHITHTKKYKR